MLHSVSANLKPLEKKKSLLSKRKKQLHSLEGLKLGSPVAPVLLPGKCERPRMRERMFVVTPVGAAKLGSNPMLHHQGDK